MVDSWKVRIGKIAFTTAVLVGFGCRDRTLQPESLQASHIGDSSIVTSAVRARMDPNGRFIMDASNSVGPGEIAEAQAVALGALWVRDFLPSIVRGIEARRGAAIHQASLAQCGRVFRAQSPWQPIDDPNVPLPVKRIFGPWWFVTYCDDQGPAILLGVAGYNTDITIVNDTMRIPPVQGNSFVGVGLAMQHPGLPLSPESVAVVVNHRTGAQVASVPDLVMPGNWGPFGLLWHVQVAHPVSLTRQTTQGVQPMSTVDLYVGAFDPGNETSTFLVASDTQPVGTDYNYMAPHIGEQRAVHPLSTAHATRAVGSPAIFDRTR